MINARFKLVNKNCFQRIWFFDSDFIMPNESHHKEPMLESSAIVIDDAEHFKIAQAIYSAATGKTEKLSKSYSKNYMIRRPDLQQLHSKCQQACSQWNVLQKSSSITIQHIDENKEQFSSFERFDVYDASKTAPIESIVYEFNILVALKGVPKPQNYKATVRIISRMAMLKRMEEDQAPPGLIRFFGSAAIVVEIEYVDYVIARNILGMIDSWALEVEQNSTLSFCRYLQRVSHWIPTISQVAIILISVLSLAKVTNAALSQNATPPEIVRWLLFAGAGLWVAGIFAKAIGRLIERSVDNVVELSAIVINKGDERLLERFGTKNRWTIIKGCFGIAIVVIQGVFTDTLTNLIVRFMHK